MGDAAARRITELYTKGVEQLGSEKAPIRLGGLYALERLAQDNPAQRATIFSVLCAYLRMPYQLPGEPPGDDAASEDLAEYREQVQEREVRLAAQHILTQPLRRNDPGNPEATLWTDFDLDLTGAVLIDFDLCRCSLRNATFANARFIGGASFNATTFRGGASFKGARFPGGASFSEGRFDGHAWFSGSAWFDNVEFSNGTSFRQARFSGEAWFRETIFGGRTSFKEARFGAHTSFEETKFSDHAWFDNAEFSEGAWFHEAAFALGVPPEVTRFLSQDDAGHNEASPPTL